MTTLLWTTIQLLDTVGNTSTLLLIFTVRWSPWAWMLVPGLLRRRLRRRRRNPKGSRFPARIQFQFQNQCRCFCVYGETTGLSRRRQQATARHCFGTYYYE